MSLQAHAGLRERIVAALVAAEDGAQLPAAACAELARAIAELSPPRRREAAETLVAVAAELRQQLGEQARPAVVAISQLVHAALPSLRAEALASGASTLVTVRPNPYDPVPRREASAPSEAVETQSLLDLRARR